MANSSEAVRVRFGEFELDLTSGELIRDGKAFRLQGQPFRVLRVLLEHAGEVVTREELQRQLWTGETFVDFEHGLNKAIAKLRDALDDGSKTASRFIQTLPRRGYRFTAEVDWIGTHPIGPVFVSPLPNAVSPRPSFRYAHIAAPAVLLLLAPTLWLSRGTIAGWLRRRPAIQSVAVLPLANISSDPAQQYLADGITEELVTDLGQAKPLRVLSLDSTRSLKDASLPIPQLAKRLKVDAIIEGTVVRSDNRLRVTIRLIGVAPERQVWAASYERNLGDTLALQKQIAADAVYQIRVQLTPEERTRLTLERRINPEAYDEYLRARYLLHQETPQANKAVPHLERAIQLDPNFAAAYAALGEGWGMEGVWGADGVARDAYRKALDYSQKAVSLDPDSAEAYASLGHSLMQSRQWNAAETALRRALELDPNNLEATQYLTLDLAEKGRLEEALALSREAATENPIAVDFRHVYAITLYLARKYDEAIAESEYVLELDPNRGAAYGSLAFALVEKGRYEEAEAAFHKSDFMDAGMQAWLYAREGKTAAARRMLESEPATVNIPGAVARYLVGDKERGLRELDFLANEEWAIKSYRLRVDPIFDRMRGDPRFEAIVRKTGLYG